MFGEVTHLRRFIEPNSYQTLFTQDALQMSGSVTHLKDSISLDEWYYAQDPVFPSAQRDSCRDQIVGESELMVEQAKEKS
jgi:hypothetical protein